MSLHPLIKESIVSSGHVTPYNLLPIDEARAQAKNGYPKFNLPSPAFSIINRTIVTPNGAVNIRIYRPFQNVLHPIMMYFHGGGFVLLDLDCFDNLCGSLCTSASCMVVSVDYRLAPEHKYPAAPDDCLAATRWMGKHAGDYGGDASRMVVAGDSAGGCLAAVTALRIRDEGGPALSGLLMLYPVTDFPSKLPASYSTYGSGFGLTQDIMLWFWQQYLPDLKDALHSNVSPLRMLSAVGLPSTYVMVAEYDLLRDEGESFAQLLKESGTETVISCQQGMNHGFLKYIGIIDEATHALNAPTIWLRKVLGILPTTSDIKSCPRSRP